MRAPLDFERLSVDDVVAADRTSRKIGPPAAGVSEREVDGCLVLLGPDRAEVLVLNETASDVWRLLDGDFTLDGIVSLIARAYAVEPSAVYQDVEGVIRLLCDHRLLCRSE